MNTPPDFASVLDVHDNNPSSCCPRLTDGSSSYAFRSDRRATPDRHSAFATGEALRPAGPRSTALRCVPTHARFAVRAMESRSWKVESGTPDPAPCRIWDRNRSADDIPVHRAGKSFEVALSLGDDVLGKMCLYLGKGFQNFAELGFRTGLLVQVRHKVQGAYS